MCINFMMNIRILSDLIKRMNNHAKETVLDI